MKSKTSIFIFSAIALVLLVLICCRIFFSDKSQDDKQIQDVNIKISAEDGKNTSRDSSFEEDAATTSFVPLLSSETLINTLTFDFDGDTHDDQVVAVYKAGSEVLYLIVGLYNPDTNAYDRVAEIKTEITKTRTFSFSNVDMTGEHITSLVYQGLKNDGDSVMKIYLCRRKQRSVDLSLIGDFTSDGTIFIHQTERSEAYELSQANGQSYIVWVYSSDKTEAVNPNNQVVSQIQTEYVWDKDRQKYVQGKQLRITGSRMAAKELARIRISVDTFADYLNGLWYRANDPGKDPRYIYFNYEDKEVIFLSDDAEGVYSWEASNLRRSGIYLTTVNSIISSMKRSFDILLSGVNEVIVNVHDNIGMSIKESNQWNGTYKKMSFQTSFDDERKVSLDREYEKVLLESVWIDESGNEIAFKDSEYKYTQEFTSDSGLFTTAVVGNYPVIQFKSYEGNLVLSPAYAMQFDRVEVPVKTTRRNQKPKTEIVINKDIIHFSPVTLSPATCYAAEGKNITFTKKTNIDNKTTN